MTFFKNIIRISGIVLLLLALGCGRKDAQITSLEMLKGGKTFAVPTGTAADQFVLKKFPDAKIEYYNTVLDCILAVRDGKADAASYDKPVVQNIVAKNDGLLVIPELMFDDQYGFAVRLEDTKLKQAMDEALADLKVNGTYAAMEKRWFPDKGLPAPMPVIRFKDTDSVLRFGTAAVTEPMSFYDANKNIAGFDIEFASYIAKKLGKRLEIVDMEFGAMIPALISGKVDMVGAGMSITEERAKKVLFSECYYPSGIAAVVRDHHKAPPEGKAGMKLKKIGDITTKRIGVLMGSVHDAYATKHFPKAEILQFQTVPDLLFALNSDKIDVIFIDKSAVRHVLASNEALGVFVDSLFSVPIGAGFNKESVVLREQFNEYLKKLKSDGTYADMIDRWMTKGLSEMPEIKFAPLNGTLNVGVVSDAGLPTTIIQNGEMIGFDIEVAERFASYCGREFVPVPLHFGSLIASISTKKID
ncbi:MAG: transporter substrate-binding domain-containing protein [bacterium]